MRSDTVNDKSSVREKVSWFTGFHLNVRRENFCGLYFNYMDSVKESHCSTENSLGKLLRFIEIHGNHKTLVPYCKICCNICNYNDSLIVN